MVIRLIYVSALLGALISCGAEKDRSNQPPDKYGGTIHINVSENIYSLVPADITNESEWLLAGQLFESVADPTTGSINQGLISSVRAVDSDTLYFDFHPNVLFSNGQPLDSSSLVHWVMRLNTNGLKCDYVTKSRSLRVRNHTMEEAVALLGDRENYLHTLANGIPVGTGPFKIKSINEDISVDLVKNTAYHNRNLPYVDAVEVRIIKTKDTEVEEFSNGSLDLILLSPLQRLHYQNVLSLERHPNYQLIERKEKVFCFGLTFNLDSLEAYQLAKVMNTQPAVYTLSGKPRRINFPNLSRSKVDTNLKIESDKSIFSQLTIEALTEEGVALSATDSVTIDAKALFLTSGTINSVGLPILSGSAKKLVSADYLIIFNSWNGLTVYQYYLKMDEPQDTGMIDLKSVYFKEPIKLD